MHKLLALSGIALIMSCGSNENPDDYLVFANGSKVKKSDIEGGFKEGCVSSDAGMPEYIDQGKYCECMLDQIMTNAGRIDIDVESDDEDAIMNSTMEYFMTDGMDMVMECLNESMDASQFDWVTQEEAFMSECLITTVDDPDYESMANYCTCVWEKVRAEVQPMSYMDPSFSESEQLAGFIEVCSAEHLVTAE